MIGVIANPANEEVVREFFELFKTPWEFYRKSHQYDVVICAGNGEFDEAARLIVVYAGRRTEFDDQHRIQTGNVRRQTSVVRYLAERIPLYGDSITFQGTGASLLADVESGEWVAHLDQSRERALVRIGYDVFEEVRTLLSVGQPAENAGIPALELHIALLRDVITGCGVSLAEIPPVPEGYQFIACLTHDVDHPSIRRHKWDHTSFGFLYRATLGSSFDLIRGRISFRDLAANWVAAFKLPLVHLGVSKDFWREFADRYLEIENGVRSTYFVIPFANRPGKKRNGPAPVFRGASYGAEEIADTIQRLQGAGCEVALHGIDAWIDSSSGREELEEICRLTGVSETGVRMHWLYYDEQSPRKLEHAGALYDSSAGYNGTVGYRVGTAQAYKPIGASRLLELPLHVMDTAMFFPSHLGLCQGEAKTITGAIIQNIVEFGGCLTLNWHDRSTAPERLWGGFYRELVQELKGRGAWFATAREATAWFRKRRLAQFEVDPGGPVGVHARIASEGDDCLPGLVLRIHKARESFEDIRSKEHLDTALGKAEASALGAG